MQGHNSALGLISEIESVALWVSIAIWGLGLIALLFARRLKWPPYLREFLCVVGASASTVAVLNRFLFVDVFAGRSGEAMLLTLPLTLLGAPLVFIVMLVCLGKLWRIA